MRFPLFFCLFTLSLFGQNSAPDAILGSWLTKDGDRIEIFRCDTFYCGKIADIVDKLYEADDPMAGKPKVDRENPDPARRADAIIGLNIMFHFSYDPEEQLWQGGTIYDPKNGKTYKCRIQFKDGNLLVRGYVGIPALGRTEVWKRPK